MKPDKPKVLFVVSIYNYHREVLPVVTYLKDTNWNVEVIIGWRGDQSSNASEYYERLGCKVHRINDSYSYLAVPTNSGGKRSTTKLKADSAYSRIKDIASVFINRLGLRRAVRDLLEMINPNVILQGPFHSCGSFDNAILVESKSLGISTACYPVSAYQGRSLAIKGRFNNLNNGMLSPRLRGDFDWINRICSIFFRQWIQKRGSQTIFMWDPMLMLGVRLAGLLERDVWHKPSVRFDRVFIYSEYSKQLLLESGYPKKNLEVVGVPLLDGVFKNSGNSEWRFNIFSELGMDLDQPFILLNVEPSAEHHYQDWDTHWENFEGIIIAAISIGVPVILSLHPLCQINNYLFAEEKFGVKIARNQNIHSLYPNCSVVLSFPCSTNLFAEIFDKPLVIYDFLQLTSEDSDTADEFRLPGALIGYSTDEIQAHLRSAIALKRSNKVIECFQACNAIGRSLENIVSACGNIEQARDEKSRDDYLMTNSTAKKKSALS